MSYIGQQLPADVFSGFVTDAFTGDGSATTFTLSKAPFSEDGLIVVINNVIQRPTTNFTVSGTTLTIVGTAVASGDVIYAIHTGGPLPIGEATKAAQLDLNGASDKLILDADADTTISADTDDQIDFKVGGTDEMTLSSTGLVINDGSNDRDFRVESNANANMLLVDGGNNIVRVGSSSHTNSLIANNHELVVGDESSGASGIALVAPNNENSYVSFFDPDNSGSFRGSINYNHSSDFLRTYVGGTETVRLQAGNAITMDVSSGATTDTTAALQLDKEDESASSSTRMIGFIVGGQGRGFIANGTSDSGAPSLSAGSDRRLKKNITAYTGGYDKIKSIPVQTWDEQFTDATGVKGWIADELEKVFPDAVTGTKDATKTVKNAIISEHGNCLKDNITEEEFNELKANGQYANCTWSASKVVPAFQMSAPLKFFPDVVQALQAAITKIETLETKVKALEDA